MIALILDTSSSSGSGGRPIRFLERSCRRSRRLERDGLLREPSFGGDGGSRSCFLTLWRVRESTGGGIRTNNPLERILREIRRRTRVVGAWSIRAQPRRRKAAPHRRHGVVDQ